MGGILVGQLQKPHTTAVGLLFYTLGGKDRINYLAGTGTDPLRPFTETVTVPFQILLVGSRHVPVSYTHLDVYKRQSSATGITGGSALPTAGFLP